MKWPQFLCWYSLLGPAHSPCRKHSQSELVQFHFHSKHYLMVWLLWSAVDITMHLLANSLYVPKYHNSNSNFSPSTGYPNCLQTTLASRLSQELSQMVPQTLLRQICTVPCLCPLLSLIWPSVQLVRAAKYFLLVTSILQNIKMYHSQAGKINLQLPKQETPASALWSQLWTPIPLWGQLRRVDSVPLHPTLSMKIPPLPLPK